ncbi:hypothetical protein F1880_008274 [Penicillium rolfsii]|nr:hypothetical protein F1880_008274 [Penicillium rolfsii]
MQIDFPVEIPLPEDSNQGGNYRQPYPLYGALNPLQQLHFNGMVLQNNLLQAQLNQVYITQTPAQPTVQAINTLDMHHNLDDMTVSWLRGARSSPPPVINRVIFEGSEAEACTGGVTAVSSGEDARFESYENIRASMLRTVHPEIRMEGFRAPSAAERSQRKARTERSASRQQVMRLRNQPLSPELISRIAEQRGAEEERDGDVDGECR